jgi:two-component system sensor histidine kinase AlgZ
VRRYINIEQLRPGNRLKVEWRIDHNVDPGVQVPALILQPLVKNAIYHGIGPLPAGGGVNLSITPA